MNYAEKSPSFSFTDNLYFLSAISALNTLKYGFTD